MSYLRATRYGLVKIETPEILHEAGWRQVWEHPGTGMLAMRHPVHGRWVICDRARLETEGGFCSSLRAAANKINRLVEASA